MLREPRASSKLLWGRREGGEGRGGEGREGKGRVGEERRGEGRGGEGMGRSDLIEQGDWISVLVHYITETARQRQPDRADQTDETARQSNYRLKHRQDRVTTGSDYRLRYRRDNQTERLHVQTQMRQPDLRLQAQTYIRQKTARQSDYRRRYRPD